MFFTSDPIQSIEKNSSLCWNVHSKWDFLDQMWRISGITPDLPILMNLFGHKYLVEFICYTFGKYVGNI